MIILTTWLPRSFPRPWQTRGKLLPPSQWLFFLRWNGRRGFHGSTTTKIILHQLCLSSFLRFPRPLLDRNEEKHHFLLSHTHSHPLYTILVCYSEWQGECPVQSTTNQHWSHPSPRHQLIYKASDSSRADSCWSKSWFLRCVTFWLSAGDLAHLLLPVHTVKDTFIY